MNTQKNKLVGIATAIGVAILVAILTLNPGQFIPSGSGRVAVTGNTSPMIDLFHLDGHANPKQSIKVVMGLKLRDPQGLEAFLKQLYTPGSPGYRKYISNEEVTERFGPTADDYAKVRAFLEAAGLKIAKTYDNRLLIAVTGNVEQVEKAFNIRISQLKRDDGTIGFVSDKDPEVPANLQSSVQAVIGISNVSHYKSKLKTLDSKITAPAGMGPAQISTAYNYPNTVNPKGGLLTGEGQTIAIATCYNYLTSDVQGYWKRYGIDRSGGSLTNVAVDDPTDEPNVETTLDIQQIGSQAPAANIVVYEGQDPEFGTFAEVFNTIVTDKVHKPTVCSVSWGLCENDMGSAPMETENTIFKEFAAQGIAIWAAAGDDGAYDSQSHHGMLSVDYPSSDPNVGAVGGTRLLLKNENDYSREVEVVWTGGGGGVSSVYDQPTWQHGGGVPDNGKRNTPDIAMVSDPHAGYSILWQGKWHHGAGGTSFAAPNMAAMWLLCVQAENRRLGNPNELIYQIGNSPDYEQVFCDITKGDNGNGQGPGYKASPGWDNATGWGAPDATALINWLNNYFAPTPLNSGN